LFFIVVDKVKKKMDENELAFEKQNAYHTKMREARLLSASSDVQKRFDTAITDGDKAATLQAKETLDKEVDKASEKTEKSMANLEHLKFAAKMAEKARKEKEEAHKKKMEEMAKKAEDEAAELAQDEADSQASGKPATEQ